MQYAAPHFEAFFSKDRLNEYWADRVSQGSARGRDGMAPRNYAPERIGEELAGAADAIAGMNYRFTAYKQMLRSKGAGKVPRVLAVPTVRDRVVHRALSEYLRASFASIGHPRPQPMVERIRRAIQSGEYSDFLRLDIKNFYPSLSHDALLEAVGRRVDDTRVLSLLAAALSVPVVPSGVAASGIAPVTRGIPAGTSIANILGEIALSDLGIRFSRDHVSFFRYVDDILVLSAHGTRQSIRSEVVSLLRPMGLVVHPKHAAGKSASGKLAHDEFEYLGYTFGPARVSVTRERRGRLIDHLARPITAYRHMVAEGAAKETDRSRCEWLVNLRITGCYRDGSRRGWLAYYSQLNDRAVLHELDSVVRGLVARLPKESRFEPKSFVRAWAKMRDSSSDPDEYIPDYDREWSDDEKLSFLRTVSYYDGPKSGSQLHSAWKRHIASAVADLERDVVALS